MTYAEFELGCTMTVLAYIYLGLEHHRINIPLIAMHYRKFTALALFICAATAAPPTAASKRSIVTPNDDDLPAAHLSLITSGFGVAPGVTYELDVIDGFVGAFGDSQAQLIEEDGTVGAASLVTQ